VLERLNSDGPVWLIDPVDGTRAFVAGESGFGVMLALVANRETVASWILLPLSDECFVSERGAGAYCNGVRLKINRGHAPERPRGTLYRRYMEERAATRLSERAGQQFVPAGPAGSAAAEYTGIVKGDKDFVVYHRLLPWDHVPGVLLVNEAGGHTQLVDGRVFSASTRMGPLIVAGDRDIGDKVLTWWQEH
jgi:fructose-1,6-bisphosphatase/inositol monophosphatase family enzyme